MFNKSLYFYILILSHPIFGTISPAHCFSPNRTHTSPISNNSQSATKPISAYIENVTALHYDIYSGEKVEEIFIRFNEAVNKDAMKEYLHQLCNIQNNKIKQYYLTSHCEPQGHGIYLYNSERDGSGSIIFHHDYLQKFAELVKETNEYFAHAPKSPINTKLRPAKSEIEKVITLPAPSHSILGTSYLRNRQLYTFSRLYKQDLLVQCSFDKHMNNANLKIKHIDDDSITIIGPSEQHNLVASYTSKSIALNHWYTSSEFEEFVKKYIDDYEERILEDILLKYYCV